MGGTERHICIAALCNTSIAITRLSLNIAKYCLSIEVGTPPQIYFTSAGVSFCVI